MSTILYIDLRSRRHDVETRTLILPATADGVAVGVMQWMHINLADGIAFENVPDSYSDGGWLQVVHTFSRPIRVCAGESFELIAGHDRTSLILMPAH